MRLVLDTNVLVSGLAYPGGPPGRLVAAWRSGGFDLASSEFLHSELARVLPRVAPRTGMSPMEVRDFLDSFRTAVAWVEPDAASLAQALASGLRDPSHPSTLPILALAIVCGADWLITGDKDLIALAGQFPILTPVEFCARHAP